MTGSESMAKELTAERLREVSADRIVQEIVYTAPVPGGDYQAVASAEKAKGKAK